MSENNKMLSVVKQLDLIYPDIQGQLCSRHSTLFGKLRTTFNKLYDSMQPQHYIIVKGTCDLTEESLIQLKLSLALENGIIILISKTYKQSEYYINSNHFTEQLIFNKSGSLEQGLNSLSTQMELIIKDILSFIPKDRQYGGIMFAHGNIPENCFNYKRTFLISFYLALLTINNCLNVITIQQLIDKMVKLKFIGTREQIERQIIMYKNRKFNLALPNLNQESHINNINNKQNISQISSISSIKQINSPQCQQQNKIKNISQDQLKSYHSLIEKSNILINMDKNYKFLFCRLDLAKQDVNYQFRRRKQLKNRKQQIIKQLKNKININTLFQLFHKINEVNIKNIKFPPQYMREQKPRSLTQLSFSQNILQQQQQILCDPHKLIQILIQQIGLISQFSNQNISLQQLISAIWQINSKYLKLHAKQVVDLVEQMKQRLGINGSMIVNQNFVMIVVEKYKYSQLLCNIKVKMNQGELKSKSLFKIVQQEELIQQRWTTDNQIGEKMFTSVPSQGIAIFDPSESIWFDL